MVSIREEVFEGECEYNGKKINLNVEHMMTHEMAHGVIGATKELPKRATELAKNIIDTAEEMGEYQTVHIQNVLRNYKKELDEFSKKPAEEQDSLGGFDNFKAKKEVALANEIITDYYSIFLRSSGEKNDYLRRYFEVIHNDKFYDQVAKELSVEEGEGSSMNKLVGVFREATREEGGLKNIIEKSPTLKKMVENGNEFYSACQEISMSELSDENGDDMEDMYGEGYGGYYAADQPSGSSGKEGKSGGFKEAAFGLLAGFAEDRKSVV